MYRFWKTVVEPFVERLKPQVIVEIGAASGSNTKQILEYCQRHDARLYSIDPAPDFDVAAWEEKYSDRWTLFQQTSLEALPQIPACDLILVNGDHNWYTVFHELQLINELASSQWGKFPAMLFHDVSWPYARRDMYYAPERIPEAYRQPYRQVGIDMKTTGVRAQGGLNSQLFNALEEGGERNGVLTAIEDFLRGRDERFTFLTVSGWNGLGILAPVSVLSQNQALASFLDNLPDELIKAGYWTALEHEDYQKDVRLYEFWLEMGAQQKRIDRLIAEQTILARSREDKDRELARLRTKIEGKIFDIAYLTIWLEELEAAIQYLLNGRRWKIGKQVGEVWRRAMRQPGEVPSIETLLGEPLGRFNAWKLARESQAGGLSAEQAALKTDVVFYINNDKGDIDAALASMVGQGAAYEYLIIVDDGAPASVSEHLQAFASLAPNRMVLRNERALGYGLAVALAINTSIADYIVCLNAPRQLASDWYQKLIDTGESDPAIGVLSLPTANGFLAFKRAVINRIGGFDTNFADPSEAHREFCLRATHAGFRVAGLDVLLAEPQDAPAATIRKEASVSEAARPIQVLGLMPMGGDGTFISSGYIRLVLPFQHPSIAGQVTFTATPIEEPDIYEADIIVVQRTVISNVAAAQAVIDHCRRKNVKLVYDIDDDLFSIPETHLRFVGHLTQRAEAARLIAYHADMITASSAYLAQKLKGFNRKLVMLPNALDEQLWQLKPEWKPPVSSDDRLHILYMGTHTHETDLQMLRPAIAQLRTEYGARLRFEMIGGLTEPGKLGEFNHIPIPSTSLSYPQFVKWLVKTTGHYAIGLAPLELTDFNRSKTYIKYLDYSALGLASVLSPIEPYMAIVTSGVNGLVAENTSAAWYEAIKRLIDDDGLRASIAANAHQLLVREHTLQIQATRWAAIYRALLDGSK